MSGPSFFERVFVLRRSDSGEEETPLRALVISVLALLVAVVGALWLPDSLIDLHGLPWILALVPCLLLSYYRGWKGAGLALVLGMCAVTLVEVGGMAILGREVDWWIYGATSLTLVTASLGMGVTTELLQRAGGDPHLADRRWRTGRELRRALDREQFLLYYEPIVDLEEGRVSAAEAKLRWDHPEMGILPPRLFLPAAVDTGLILPLGAWMVEQACTDLAAWRKRFEHEGREFRLHVNLSGSQCTDRSALQESVIDPLDRTEVPPERLCFELAEAVLVEAEDGIRELRDGGAAVIIDDFGTESGSLEHLTWMHVDGFKIDRTFTGEVLGNERTAVVVGSMLEMGTRLGLTVTADGIETTEQMARLDALGCRLGQGFLFGQPLPLSEALGQASATEKRFTAAAGGDG